MLIGVNGWCWDSFLFFCRNLSGSSLKGFLTPDLSSLSFLQELYVYILYLMLVFSLLEVYVTVLSEGND